MRFIDEARVHVKAGDGGRGASSFFRAKFMPQGGPDGGDGGDGGSVILVAKQDVATLLDLHFRRQVIAESGKAGGSAQCTGRSGKDCVIAVPVGTLVRSTETGLVLADLAEPEQSAVVAQGGQGGRGNMRFASSTNRAPTRFDEGVPGESRDLLLELKLLADVGLIGFPNAGKSTLISRISAARPKIADYPFTTLVPCLGMVRMQDYQSFVVADIPGLIEGASQGAGLGLRFLRHIERTRIFLHLISLEEAETTSPLQRFSIINEELASYDKELASRLQLVVLTKIDAMPDREETLPKIIASFAHLELKVFPISAVTGEGLTVLLYEVAERLKDAHNSNQE